MVDPVRVRIVELDYSDLEGGLARMLDRFREEGTLTGDAEADDFLRQDGNAALLGLLYDQRVRAEYAFTGPHRLRDRLGHLDLAQIAVMTPERLREIFAEKPAVHRFTNKMADTTHEVARLLVDQYEGRADRLWSGDVPFEVVATRVLALPGFGKDKTRKLRYVLHYFGHRDFSGS